MVEIKDNRSKEEFDFEYYERIEGEGKVNTPIRAVYNKDRHVAIAVDTVDAETGNLVQGNLSVLMRDVRTSPYVEEITEEKFYELCEQKAQKKTSIKPEIGLG